MGHTDVVPVNPDGWQRDPFGGEFDRRRGLGPRRGRHAQPHRVDGGRVPRPRALAASSPTGTLVYLAVADEENLGTWGAEHLVEHERDAVEADYVVTEVGRLPDADAERARACR